MTIETSRSGVAFIFALWVCGCGEVFATAADAGTGDHDADPARAGDAAPFSCTSCALGCDQSQSRCIDVLPSNDLASFLDMAAAAPAVVLTSGATIDTDLGTIVDGDGSPITAPTFELPASAGGAALRVFAVSSLTLRDTEITGGRALAIVSDGEISVTGHVRVDAGEMSSTGCVGDQPPPCEGVGTSGLVCAGSGGGGFASAGGRGGNASATDGTSVSGGAGGGAAGNFVLVPLRGGCAGGNSTATGDAGAGGGAIQLVSRRAIAIDTAGAASAIDAGGGGSPGIGGGGSGGAILLEAPLVVVASGASIVANGGSGGCASEPGEPGQLTTAPAAGGDCTTSGHGDGGDGASRASTTAGNGASVSVTAVGFGGGGGGGRGRIRINVPTPADYQELGAVSPAPSLGELGTR